MILGAPKTTIMIILVIIAVLAWGIPKFQFDASAENIIIKR